MDYLCSVQRELGMPGQHLQGTPIVGDLAVANAGGISLLACSGRRYDLGLCEGSLLGITLGGVWHILF